MDAIQAYLDELYRWNQRINLTAVPREQAEQKHVAESTALLDAVAPADGARLVDVGSGGGVPGIPIAVARPDLRVVLLESDQRKAAFLTHACGLLQLGNVEVVCARAEDEARREGMREAFDVAVSRALASPPSMCELLLPLVRVGGMVATLVGDAALAKRESAHAAELLGGAPPQIAPGGVLLVEKLVPTPDLYPRRAGLPTRRPLR